MVLIGHCQVESDRCPVSTKVIDLTLIGKFLGQKLLLENSSIKKSCVPIPFFFKPGRELDNFTGKLIQKKAFSRK